MIIVKKEYLQTMLGYKIPLGEMNQHQLQCAKDAWGDKYFENAKKQKKTIDNDLEG